MMDALRPDAFVEEGRLAQNISQLRKLLAADFADLSPIETIPKVGIAFGETCWRLWNRRCFPEAQLSRLEICGDR